MKNNNTLMNTLSSPVVIIIKVVCKLKNLDDVVTIKDGHMSTCSTEPLPRRYYWIFEKAVFPKPLESLAR